MVDRKGLTEHYSVPSEAEDIENFKWPPFWNPDEVSFFVQRVSKAARNEAERQTFMAILRRAYEDALELEILYCELPGVFMNNHTAMKNFREVLVLAGQSEGKSVAGGLSPSEVQNISVIDSFEGRQPRFLIQPSRIWFIANGIDRISHGNDCVYQRYSDTLLGLWEKTTYLELLYRKALEGVQAGGRDRLYETLSLIARDTRAGKLPPETEALSKPDRNEELGRSLVEVGRKSMPNTEGLWPTSKLDITLNWPPPRWPPKLLPQGILWGDIREFLCAMEIVKTRPFYAPQSTYATGIASISPQSACTGGTVMIIGSGFGASQPGDVEVMIGEMEVPRANVKWSDTSIEIKVPSGAKSGCVGFINKTLEQQRKDAYANAMSVARRPGRTDCLKVIFTGMQIPYTHSHPPCTGTNFLGIGLPEIDLFKVNGETDLTVEPNTPLILTWGVSNASTIKIRRTSAGGPDIDVSSPAISPSRGTLNLGAFIETRPTNTAYELSARNSCGSIKAAISVYLRKTPKLRILGIEAIQAIQHFDLANPSQNNSVRLVANKRTMVRVYVDSGITDGFNNGAGPNEQANVTGYLTIWSGTSTVYPTVSGPLNTRGVVTARPFPDRNNLQHTLNFELPSPPSGTFGIEARVYVDGYSHYAPETGWNAVSKTTVTFLPRHRQEVLPFLIIDRGLPAPTIQEYYNTLGLALKRLPFAEDGFIVNPPVTYINNNALDGPLGSLGWGLLVNSLATIVFLFPSRPVGGIRTAIVPQNRNYALGGIALPRIAVTVPAIVSQANLGATFGQELCHLYGVGHAPCPAAGQPGAPDGIDLRLPDPIGDIGMDVPLRLVIPADRHEVMSYCGDDNNWSSIALWDIMIDTSPI